MPIHSSTRGNVTFWTTNNCFAFKWHFLLAIELFKLFQRWTCLVLLLITWKQNNSHCVAIQKKGDLLLDYGMVIKSDNECCNGKCDGWYVIMWFQMSLNKYYSNTMNLRSYSLLAAIVLHFGLQKQTINELVFTLSLVFSATLVCLYNNK